MANHHWWWRKWNAADRNKITACLRLLPLTDVPVPSRAGCCPVFFHVVSQAGFFSFVLGNICGGHAGCGGGTGRPEGGAGSHRGWQCSAPVWLLIAPQTLLRLVTPQNHRIPLYLPLFLKKRQAFLNRQPYSTPPGLPVEEQHIPQYWESSQP